jgi:hypothetical protein
MGTVPLAAISLVVPMQAPSVTGSSTLSPGLMIRHH